MPGPVFLEGERVTLRTVQSEDHEFLVRNLNDPKIRHGGYETVRAPVSKDDIVTKVESDDSHTFLVCLEGTPIGSASIKGIDQEGRKAELSYWIVPDEQAKGYATEAADICLTHAFNELGLHKVWARTVGDNESSKRVLEKLDFNQEGILREHWYGFGRYVDEY
ncbi:GNAT family N-acetyltransferase [Natrinema soli]|uniref:GNAT family N-acetyltransferase n=1 Tax=Natrinema soli TaxID=1930624 RepID=A0ABD5SMF9_9EURY|nr:GNAT family protein [Natrinema soli]